MNAMLANPSHMEYKTLMGILQLREPREKWSGLTANVAMNDSVLATFCIATGNNDENRGEHCARHNRPINAIWDLNSLHGQH